MNKKYRRVIIAGNWKMNKLPSEVKPFLEELKDAIPEHTPGCSIVLCVPATHLASMSREKHRRIGIGAQNVSQFDKGAHTGEISVDMIDDLGARYCIVGHSERRADNGDTDEIVNAKVHALLNRHITPILCVGESLEQRDRGLTIEHITYQVKAALYGLEPEQVKKVVIAYEPIWAIGTGRTATDEQAQEVCFAIRELLRREYSAMVSRKVCILYGGSMNAKNCAGLLAQPDIDGGLIGGASLKVEDFAVIVREGSRAE
ncbi:MAG: triose-phosphate isomerase [Oscillospiraceae bacterium]|nr:triose-phosphate isomerase [Oscillospiraceae bacterium]